MFVEKIKDDEYRKFLQYFIEDFVGNFKQEKLTIKDPERDQMIAEMVKDDRGFVLPRYGVVEVNEKIESPGSVVPPWPVIEYFIKCAGHRVAMKFCICREGQSCKKYPQELGGCIFLGDAAKHIHPEVGHAVSVEVSLEHARRCIDVGLVPVVAKSSPDPIWLRVRPENKLLTMCFCCECCCGQRALPYFGEVVSDHISRMPGIKVSVTEACTGCGACIEECIYNAIHMEENLAGFNDADCRGCGRCADVCPENAVRITLTDSEYIEKIVR